MTNPSIESLLKRTEDRFTLCIITGKRARRLIDGDYKLTTYSSKNVVSIAANEINEDRINFVRTKSGIK